VVDVRHDGDVAQVFSDRHAGFLEWLPKYVAGAATLYPSFLEAPLTIIALHEVEKSFGSWTLFRDLELDVPDQARLGVVGPNGAGKSTLLRILAGLEQVEGGEVTRRKGTVTAYLPQLVEGDDRTALQTVLAARPDVAELDDGLRAVERELTDPSIGSDLRRMERTLKRQEELLERWVAAGGAGLDGEIRSTLERLGLEPAQIDQPTAVLSGGQRKLVALAACLIRRPDVLLLDEPEAHLDTPRREALEQLIRSFEGAVVIVSHDRHLLDETVSGIVEVDRGRIALWPGNYSAYAVARELALKRQQQAYVTQQKEIARLEAAIHRFRAWFAIAGDHRNIVRARQKERQIERMDKVDRPVFERRKMALELRPGVRGGQKVVDLRRMTVAFDEDPVLLDVDLRIFRGERVGVVGPVGAGKTVLGRVIAGLLEPTFGERWAGPSIRFGYIGQDPAPTVPRATPIEMVRSTSAMYEEQAIALLGRYLFRYDQMRGPVENLSGGERTRLELLMLTLGGANCLVLDEPTNHLDIESLEVLEGELERFDGTAVVISHDRYFLERIPDRIVEVDEAVVRSFDGGYSDWSERRTVTA
jgi:ATP-binding cassette, subfamily F, member 3